MAINPKDTAPIRQEERFDEARLADYLRRHVEELDEAESISFEQFPGGHANLTYLARAGDQEFVVRRPPLGPVAPRSHDMVREHRVLARLHRLYPLAPRAIHLCTDETVMGKPFFVMERRRGFVIREDWPDGLADTPDMRARAGDSLIEALVDLHRVDFDSVGLGDLGHPDGFVERQVRGWTERWNRAKTREVPAMTRLAEVLPTAIPEPQTATILHNDFKLDNTAVGPDGALVAIYDWDMATLGDPLIDFATAYTYWSEPDDPPDLVFAKTPLLEGGFPTRVELAQRYEAGTGFDLGHLAWYRAFAFFKVAVIVEQIFMRYDSGQTSDERFAVFGERTEHLAEAGLELAGSLA